MSLPMLFAAGVRLQLLELAPKLKTRIVYDCGSFTSDSKAGVRAEWPDGTRAHATLLVTKGQPGCPISVATPGRRTGLIYATRAEAISLTRVVATFALDLPVARSIPYDTTSMTVWYTPAAGRECPNPDIRDNGNLLEVDREQRPRTADLFEEGDFWAMLRAFRDAKTCRTTAGALADFVQERGFDRLAERLRSDPVAAVKVLPTKSVCPIRFARCVST